MKGCAASVHGEHEHDAAVATLWRAWRGWPRRRTSASSVESPCEVGTISGKRSLLGIILAGKQNFHRLQYRGREGGDGMKVGGKGWLVL